MSVILLVEDNELNWDMLSRRLGRKGYQVVVRPMGSRGWTWRARKRQI
jgi:two-component system cell cycle response regulator DivK